MKQNKTAAGHLCAFLTILIWGTTFISTKVLLKDFTPVEILFCRFLLGTAVLCIVSPRRLRLKNPRQEFTFACAGLCGVCLYYLLENIALTYTLASNVGIIVSVSPFFVAILTHLFSNGERLKKRFFLGFVVAVAGIVLINVNEAGTFQFNPKGDLLALCAAIVWAAYSLLSKRISSFGYNTIQATRRTFFYGLLFMVPALFLFGFSPSVSSFKDPVCVLNLLYLGVGASALCFVTWNYAVRCLGAVKTSIYIYLVPVITIVTAVIVLHERLTAVAGVGAVLTLAGLVISENRKGIQ